MLERLRHALAVADYQKVLHLDALRATAGCFCPCANTPGSRSQSVAARAAGFDVVRYGTRQLEEEETFGGS
jgi:hypothetical protein